MTPLDDGDLRQERDFSFLHRRKRSFKEPDNFMVHICWNDRGDSGCARLNYQAILSSREQATL